MKISFFYKQIRQNWRQQGTVRQRLNDGGDDLQGNEGIARQRRVDDGGGEIEEDGRGGCDERRGERLLLLQ